jgi:hypothetical protein
VCGKRRPLGCIESITQLDSWLAYRAWRYGARNATTDEPAPALI